NILSIAMQRPTSTHHLLTRLLTRSILPVLLLFGALNSIARADHTVHWYGSSDTEIVGECQAYMASLQSLYPPSICGSQTSCFESNACQLVTGAIAPKCGSAGSAFFRVWHSPTS